MMNSETGAHRYNEGKLLYHLAPPFAQREYVAVLTKGATKYAPRNWEKGLPWCDIISSMERHLWLIKQGENHDSESKLLHSAHVMANAAFLTEYYYIYPQGDDRPSYYRQDKSSGIFIDTST